MLGSPEISSLLLSLDTSLVWEGQQDGAQCVPDSNHTEGKCKALTSTQPLREALAGPGVDLTWVGSDVPTLHMCQLVR